MHIHHTYTLGKPYTGRKPPANNLLLLQNRMYDHLQKSTTKFCSWMSLPRWLWPDCVTCKSRETLLFYSAVRYQHCGQNSYTALGLLCCLFCWYISTLFAGYLRCFFGLIYTSTVAENFCCLLDTYTASPLSPLHCITRRVEWTVYKKVLERREWELKIVGCLHVFHNSP